MIGDECDAITHWECLIQFHFKVDPDTLSDDDLVKYIGRLRYALKKVGQWQM